MHRRGFCLGVGASGVSAVVAGSAVAQEVLDTDRSAVWTADVDFLLAELPRRAGHFFAAKKVDWPAVEAEFRAAAKAVKSDAEHVVVCRRLLARLKDGHAGMVDVKVAVPDESRGRRWTGPRVHLVVIGDGVFVRTAFGAAADLGVKAGQRVTTIDGQPARSWLEMKVAEMRDDTGYSTDHQALYAACHWGLAEWEGTPITFGLGEETGPVRELTIVRSGGPNFAPLGPAVFPGGLKRIGRQSHGVLPGGFGYIHLRDVPSNLPEQLDAMLVQMGAAPGLVLDLRGNGGGGCDHAAVMGRFVPKGEFWGEYESAGSMPFTGPMVVIIDAGVRSAGETVAGMFLEESRAYGLGDTPTAGMSAAKATLTLPSGMFSVRFAVRTHMGRYNRRRGIEGIGLSPSEQLPYDPVELRAGVDTQIRRAEALLRGGFPEDTVDYQPPDRRKPD